MSLPAPEIPAPLSLTASSCPYCLCRGWASIGIPLVLTHGLQTATSAGDLGMDGIWDRENLTCVRVEGCPGMRWQSISQISPYVKIGMLNRNHPRTTAKSGPYPVTFIQLPSVFPGQNSHRRSQMRSDFAHCGPVPLALWSRGGIGPLAGRDPGKSENWRYVLGG